MSNGGAKPSTSSTFHLVAGLGSGFTSAVLLQPADLLKTRMQQERQHAQLTTTTTTPRRSSRPPRLLLHTLRTIAASPHPLRQLWRGTLPSTIRTSVGSALYFSTLNKLRTSLAANLPNSTSRAPAAAASSTLPTLPAHLNLLTGAFARAAVGFALMPVTVLKVRYESSAYGAASTQAGLLGSARDLARTEGLRGFFAGAGATAVRDAPYAGLYVVVYEAGKRALGDTPLPGGPAGVNFASAVLAASAATVLTNPPDAVKTRLQLDPRKYRNSLHAVRLMLATEGVRSLFDGLGLRMARKGLSSALAWTVYEEVVRRAEGRWIAMFGGS